MSEAKRVGAILSANKDGCKFLGYGTYVGDEVPPESVGLSWPNPKIVLDNGDVVWGCQCWWGNEEEVKKMLLAYPRVDIVNLSGEIIGDTKP